VRPEQRYALDGAKGTLFVVPIIAMDAQEKFATIPPLNGVNRR